MQLPCRYTFVKHEGNQIGTDAITTGLLFDSKTTSLSDDSITIPLPTQHFVTTETKKGKTSEKQVFKAQRPSFLQNFKINNSSEELTVVVNHLKSKGSGCWEDEPANLIEDGQQHCNAFRVSAVKHLGDELEKLKSDGKLSDNTLLIGDFNSYAQEDPILLLTNNPGEANRELKTASFTSLDDGKTFIDRGKPQTLSNSYGFTNLITNKNSDENARFYSFSYSGELGNLDHAFGSQALLNKVTKVEDWHINSVESTMLDYTTKYKPKDKLEALYSDNAFRSSDHDPVVIDMAFKPKDSSGTNTGDDDDSGSMGWFTLGLGLLGLAGRRRKKKAA